MRNILARVDTTAIDAQIDAVINEMTVYGPAAPEYPDLLEKLERLEKLKADTRPKPLSLDTVVLAGVNLLGILIIVGAERQHVLTSKAMGMLPRSMK